MQKTISLVLEINRRPWIAAASVLIIGLGLMSLFTALLTPPDLNQPDSPAYLAASLLRPPGYPAFLAIVRHFDPTFVMLPYLQMGTLIISAAVLAEACHRLRPSALAWGLFGAAVFSNPFLWRYAQTIMTESLFISSIMLFLACVATAIRRRPQGFAWLTIASVVLGVAILIRPVAYGLLASSLVGAIFWWRPRYKAALALLGPAMACVIAVSCLNLATRGVFATQVFGGYSLVGHVSFLIRPQSASPYNNVMAPIASTLKPVANHLPSGISNWSRYYWVTSEGLPSAAYTTIMPMLKTFVERQNAASGASLSEDQSIIQVDALAKNVANATILQNPLAYAWHATVNFAALWTLPVILSADDARETRNALCAPEFEGFYCHNGRVDAVMVAVPKAAAVLKNFLFGLLAILSFALAVAALALGRTSHLLAFLGFTAMCINAHHALVALVNAGLPRYAMAMWPYLSVLVAGTFLLIAPAIYRGFQRLRCTN